MKIKSIYLENKGYTIDEFRNKIIEELENRKIYELSTRVSKFQLSLKYKNNKIVIPYRALEQGNIQQIIDFYEDDIRCLFNGCE